MQMSRDFSSVQAAGATATASVDYAELSKRLHIDVSYAGAGRVKAAKRITVLGQTLTPSVSAAPQLIGDTIAFGAVRIDGLGAVAGALAPEPARACSVCVSRSAAFRSTCGALAVRRCDGLSMVLTGSHLTYSKS